MKQTKTKSKAKIIEQTPPQPQQGYGWAKFGYTLSILSFIGMFLGAFCTFSFLGVILYYFVLMIIAICTLFLLLLNDTFRSYLNGGETLTQISSVLANVGTYICGGTIATALLSFIILVKAKAYQHRTAGIVLSIISIIVSIISIILHYTLPLMA